MNSHDPQSTQSTMPRVATHASDSVRQQLLATLPVTERILSLNGVVTAVLEGGSGPPIVLLHGPPAYGASWIHLIPDLVTSHRVIAPDLPGHGASHRFDGATTIERVSAWLEELVERTCHTPPVVLGHTLGGSIAANYVRIERRRLPSPKRSAPGSGGRSTSSRVLPTIPPSISQRRSFPSYTACFRAGSTPRS
jgi:alpha-beta hydrolase superfamily lysophospholipase